MNEAYKIATHKRYINERVATLYKYPNIMQAKLLLQEVEALLNSRFTEARAELLEARREIIIMLAMQTKGKRV